MPTDVLEKFYRRTPLVIAHRGASFDAPENTLVAFSMAKKQGADGIELDVWLTADGVPVVIHNDALDETTDGTGFVHAKTLHFVKSLDAGSHFDVAYKGEGIPTLDEALGIAGPELIVNIELKSKNFRGVGLEKSVYNVIRRHNASRRVIVSSFNPFALRRFRLIAPEIPIGYLYSLELPLYLRYGWLMLGLPHEARHPQERMIDAQYIDWAKGKGYRINTWTVNDPRRIRELGELGVDAIITDRPALALEALGRVGAKK
jgi:glycerophosphoryl diester phosphodiesterase